MRLIILTMLATSCGFGITSAFAGDGDGPVANTQFTRIPGVIAEAFSPGSKVADNARRGDGARTTTYVMQHSNGTWLGLPNEGAQQ